MLEIQQPNYQSRDIEWRYIFMNGGKNDEMPVVNNIEGFKVNFPVFKWISKVIVHMNFP